MFKISDNLIINTIRSGKGDCIHFRYGVNKLRNVIIDSGPTSSSGEFRKLYHCIIGRGEKVDALFITHYDDDHIGGILKLVQTEADLKFDAVYFNAYQAGTELSPNLSAFQNQRLFHILMPTSLHMPALAGQIIELGDGKFRIVAPTQEMLSKAKEKMKGADEHIPLAATSDWNKSLDELMEWDYPSVDTSISNQASIVMVFEYEGVKLLLCGDATADCILSGIGKNEHFDIVKLPHHGSARNISDEFLARISANVFLICADGSSHPSKLTVAKLLKQYGNVNILSNYSWWNSGFLTANDKQYSEKLGFRNIT